MKQKDVSQMKKKSIYMSKILEKKQSIGKRKIQRLKKKKTKKNFKTKTILIKFKEKSL